MGFRLKNLTKYLNTQPLKNYAIYFIIYSVIGITVESTINAIRPIDLIQENQNTVYCGFVYGLIAIILIFLYQKQIQIWSVGFDIIVTSITVTIIQQIIIKILTLFNYDYRLLWNYENKLWTIHDTISLPHALLFGICATFCLWVVQPIIEETINPVNISSN